jgi:hypothetical protein
MSNQNQTITGFIAGVYSILAGLAMNEVAAIVGMLGVAATVFFAWRRDVREQRALAYQLGLKPDRRQIEVKDELTS